MRQLIVCLLVLSCLAAHSRPGFAEDAEPHLVILVAEREYKTESSLRDFSKKHLDDYRVSFVTADPDERNRLVGLEAIETADVLLVSVRRRTLPEEQLQKIRDYVAEGKPVLGIRTANHAFSVRGKDVGQGRAVWPEWDKEVFGGNYNGHYGNSLDVTVTVDPKASKSSPLLKGLRDVESFEAGGSLYRVSPLAPGANSLMSGRVEGKEPEPVAWTFRREGGGKSFYTSLGHEDDFAGEVLPQLLLNALSWSRE